MEIPLGQTSKHRTMHASRHEELTWHVKLYDLIIDSLRLIVCHGCARFASVSLMKAYAKLYFMEIPTFVSPPRSPKRSESKWAKTSAEAVSVDLPAATC